MDPTANMGLVPHSYIIPFDAAELRPSSGAIYTRLRKIVHVLSGEHTMGELMQKAYCVTWQVWIEMNEKW